MVGRATGNKKYKPWIIMHEKNHIVCHLCNEPQCLGKDCFFLTYPDEITRGLKNLVQGRKKIIPAKNNPKEGNNSLTEGNKNLVDFRYLPAYFRGGKKAKEVMIKQEKRYIVCYLCDEPKCLEEECLFLTDPRDITRGMKNYVSFIDVPFGSSKIKEIPGGKVKETPVNLLYINGVKLFWFCVVIGAIIYLLVFWGLPFFSTAFFSMQSQLPLQVYISIFGVGITAVCLAMANLFGTEREATK
jgi:hypothetical protein